MTPFSERSIGAAIRDLDFPLVSGLMTASKNIYDSLLYGKSCEEELFDGNRQSFDLSYINWDEPDKNIWQVTDEFSVERSKRQVCPSGHRHSDKRHSACCDRV
jgi:type I restriction enzyme R subunit